MLTFAKEIIGALVHGLLALLCYYCACYNHIRGQDYRAIGYMLACLVECYAVFIHLEAAFNKGERK